MERRGLRGRGLLLAPPARSRGRHQQRGAASAPRSLTHREHLSICPSKRVDPAPSNTEVALSPGGG
jgi:hypothetical protein